MCPGLWGAGPCASLVCSGSPGLPWLLSDTERGDFIVRCHELKAKWLWPLAHYSGLSCPAPKWHCYRLPAQEGRGLWHQLETQSWTLWSGPTPASPDSLPSLEF